MRAATSAGFFSSAVLPGETSDIELLLLSESLNDDDVQKKGRAWVLTRQVDSRIEPLLVNHKRFQSDEGSPILEIVRKAGMGLVI